MSRRNALLKALLGLLATVLALSLGEVLTRLWERRALAPSTWLDADPVELGKLGFNDTRVPRAKPPGEFRVLSFGDSFAYSIMSPRFSYAGLIAGDLNRSPGRPRVRVVNLGEGATTVRDYAAAHAFWERRIEHDAALFNIYLGNDILDVAYGYTQVRWKPNHLFLDRGLAGLAKTSPVPHKFPSRLLDHAYALYRTRTAMVETPPLPAARGGLFNPAARHNLSEEAFLEVNRIQMVNFDPSRMDSLAAGYRAMIAFFRYLSEVRRRGTKTLVVLSPNQAQVEPALRQRIAARDHLDLSAYDLTLPARTIAAIRDMVDPELELLDLTPRFVCASEKGEQLYYLTNTHWGPAGNALAGRIIADRIRRSWLGQPPAPADAECDAAAYRPRPGRADRESLARFVRRVAGADGGQTSAAAP